MSPTPSLSDSANPTISSTNKTPKILIFVWIILAFPWIITSYGSMVNLCVQNEVFLSWMFWLCTQSSFVILIYSLSGINIFVLGFILLLGLVFLYKDFKKRDKKLNTDIIFIFWSIIFVLILILILKSFFTFYSYKNDPTIRLDKEYRFNKESSDSYLCEDKNYFQTASGSTFVSKITYTKKWVGRKGFNPFWLDGKRKISDLSIWTDEYLKKCKNKDWNNIYDFLFNLKE